MAATHYNDWPNSQGFDADYQEPVPVELKIEGQIPSYAAGVLYRTGLGPRTIQTDNGNTFQVHHWFDNFTQVHRFQIYPPQNENPMRVTYMSRITSDGIIEKIKKTGKLDSFTFARQYEPCKSFFQKVQSTFRSLQPLPPLAPNEVNIGVTMTANFPGLSKTGESRTSPHDKSDPITLCNKTDAATIQMLDPETLEPVGIAKQSSLNPELKGAISGAHAKSDPVTGDVYNYNLDFGRTGTYRVFRASPSTGKTSVLATIPYTSAYLHSLFLTDNFVILCIWNSFYAAGGAAILWNRNLLDSMTWDPSRPTTWFVVDKRTPEEGGRGLVATFESEPFYCFHTVNAYEEPSANADGGNVDLICDLAAYNNMDVLHQFYFENLTGTAPNAGKWSDPANEASKPTYRRYRLRDVPLSANNTVRRESISSKPTVGKAILEFKSSTAITPELPTLNPHYATKKHRYVYGINDSGKSSFVDSLIKYDAQTHEIKKWSKHGHTAAEAIFIPDPAADVNDVDAEDQGILLTVVLDGFAGKSYLLCLDAKDLSELGRAHVDGVVGFAFHGLYLSEQNAGEEIGKGGINGMNV